MKRHWLAIFNMNTEQVLKSYLVHIPGSEHHHISSPGSRAKVLASFYLAYISHAVVQAAHSLTSQPRGDGEQLVLDPLENNVSEVCLSGNTRVLRNFSSLFENE